MKKILMLSSLVFLVGCAGLWDAPRNILGFSTRDMDDARANSLYQSYQGDQLEIFNAVLAIAKDQKYYVFTKDDVRGLIVLMDIPGAVNTTEVGVFLTPVPSTKGGVKVELSSRSTPAKRAVAQVLFVKLAEKFQKI